MRMTNVVAVIVSYKPDRAVLSRLLDCLSVQVGHAVIVDNGTDSSDLDFLRSRGLSNEHLIELRNNFGIGAAQNRGVLEARNFGATHIILFDHDSCPESQMVEALLNCLKRLQGEGRRVASVGPCYVDERQANPPPFIRVRGLKLARCMQPDAGDAASVDYLIASGCLMPMAVIDEVGGMNGDLFIDYVDIEWGQRARSLGYENFGCFSARMEHSLGDEPIRFMGTSYPARSPLRHYYMFRNAVLLYRMKHIPADWKWADGLRGVLRFGFYVLFARPRMQHFLMMTKGIWHGLRGRTGPFAGPGENSGSVTP